MALKIRYFKIYVLQLKQCFEGNVYILNVYIRKERRCKNSDLNFYIKNLENEEQVKTKVSKGEEVKISGQEKKKENKHQRS